MSWNSNLSSYYSIISNGNMIYHLGVCMRMLSNKRWVQGKRIGPLKDPFTWYKITCWDASCTVELRKQRQVKVDWYELLCFGNPTVQLASQHVWFCTMLLVSAEGLLTDSADVFTFSLSLNSDRSWWFIWEVTINLFVHTPMQSVAFCKLYDL